MVAIVLGFVAVDLGGPAGPPTFAGEMTVEKATFH
jgi:hypothetical protein